ncbi:MAG: hypothetical protein KatS3mg082_2706 [Nitrospiraceae bacterium]|nr:MAG: hypothetical protein KatS3mg082_2573 [Nitrospiraceae bacterium]GIW56302.1 MAG: hypothetical protein KatS3mg082_2706 [Nitrospiraceae bacterium]GIW80423.1 MAG: hypothetical protein KatS3mg105_2230 [Gemmatales bacterium]
MLTVELPYPPSINHYWRRVGTRTLISRTGRRFRRQVMAILAGEGVEPLAGPLAVDIELYPPDRRRRDVDNCLKSVLDALETAGAYHDDCQVVRLAIAKCHTVPGGKTVVRISEAATMAPLTADPKRKKRKCLKCGQWFDSSGPGNRICRPCARINAGIRITEKELRSQRGGKRRNGEPMASDGDVDTR